MNFSRSLGSSHGRSFNMSTDDNNSWSILKGVDTSLNFRNKDYPSASAALDAYISEFTGSETSPKQYKRDVNDLLLPRSILSQTVDRSLQTGVRHTQQEKRLYENKKLLDESYERVVQHCQRSKKLQDALAESARLLHKVALDVDELSSLPEDSEHNNNDSDVQSMSTDMLLSAKPILVGKDTGSKRKHVYSYKTPQGRSKHNDSLKRSANTSTDALRRSDLSHHETSGRNTSLSVSFSEKPPNVKQITPRESSADSASIDSQKRHVSHRSSVLSPRNTDKPKQNFEMPHVKRKQRIKGCLSSPINLPKRSPPSGYYTGGRAPPSWITDVPTHITDHRPTSNWMTNTSTDVQKRAPSAPLGGRPPPSWITDVPGYIEPAPHAGRPPPSWITEVTSERPPSAPVGGRPPPSWITDVPTKVSPSSIGRKSPGMGGRVTPSWITDVCGAASPEDRKVLRSGGRIQPSWITEVPTVVSTPPKSRDSLSPGGRVPPSWITDVPAVLTTSPRTRTSPSGARAPPRRTSPHSKGNVPPSWITDVTTSVSPSIAGRKSKSPTYSGRLPPSWITDVPTNISPKSNIPTSSGGRVPPSWITDVPTNISPKSNIPTSSGGRVPPSWITDVPGTYERQTTSSSDALRTNSDTEYSTDTDSLLRRPSSGRETRTSKKASKQFQTSDRIHQSVMRKLEQMGAGQESTTDSTSELVYQSPFGKNKQKRSDIHKHSRDDLHKHKSSAHKHQSHQHNRGKHHRVKKTSSIDTEDLLSQQASWQTSSSTSESTITRGNRVSAKVDKILTDASRFLATPSPDLVDDSKILSPETEAVLAGERSWEDYAPYKPPKYLSDTEPNAVNTSNESKPRIIDKFIDDCLEGNKKKASPRLTGRQQPGSMEALKNMLFTIQTMAPSSGQISEEDSDKENTLTDRQVEESENVLQTSDLENHVPHDGMSHSDSNFTKEPGGKSLERALHHLSRLKSLVQTTETPTTTPTTGNSSAKTTDSS